MILLEIFYKLKNSARLQLLLLFDAVIKSNIPKIDNVLANFFRTISEGIFFVNFLCKEQFLINTMLILGCEHKETCSIVASMAEILNTTYAREWIW